MFDHLFEDDPNFVVEYDMRWEEWWTPAKRRDYCSNPKCGRFLHKRCSRREEHRLIIVRCIECDIDTCSTCSQAWTEVHVCKLDDELGITPAWVPEYDSNTCRCKRCPGQGCQVWIEHGDGCNHMTCHICEYEFCFVCLYKYYDEHGDHNCDCSGIRDLKYDELGYEIGNHGLHRDTGLDRQGRNVKGEYISPYLLDGLSDEAYWRMRDNPDYLNVPVVDNEWATYGRNDNESDGGEVTPRTLAVSEGFDDPNLDDWGADWGVGWGAVPSENEDS